MINGCFFNYAGKYSGDYSLILCYVDREEEYVTGATYEPITDKITSNVESILYGFNYSDNPLEFTVDIVNPDDSVSMRQMADIKDWLFGQDGWKKLTINAPEYANVYLNCIFIPDSDIRDGTGYRGVRCTVKNISGFWYGKDKEIIYTKAELQELVDYYNTNGLGHMTTSTGKQLSGISEAGNLTIYPEIETHAPDKVFPIFEFNYSSTDYDYNNLSKFRLHNYVTIGTDTFSDYHSDLSLDSTIYHGNGVCVFDSKHASLEVNNSPSLLTGVNTNYDLLYLKKGVNRITLAVHNEVDVGAHVENVILPDYLKITYTPMYRIGGF